MINDASPFKILCVVCGEPAVETGSGNATCARKACVEKLCRDLQRAFEKMPSVQLTSNIELQDRWSKK